MYRLNRTQPGSVPAKRTGASGPTGMIARVFMLPVSVMEFGIGMVTQSAGLIRTLTQDEAKTAASAVTPADPLMQMPAQVVAAPPQSTVYISAPVPQASPANTASQVQTGYSQSVAGENRKKENKRMADMDLADDQVKLVQYHIVSLQREAGGEAEIHSGNDMVHENLTQAAYVARVAAKYARNNALTDEQVNNLAITFEVVDRWERKKVEVVDRLEGINKSLAEIGGKIG